MAGRDEAFLGSWGDVDGAALDEGAWSIGVMAIFLVKLVQDPGNGGFFALNGSNLWVCP